MLTSSIYIYIYIYQIIKCMIPVYLVPHIVGFSHFHKVASSQQICIYKQMHSLLHLFLPPFSFYYRLLFPFLFSAFFCRSASEKTLEQHITVINFGGCLGLIHAAVVMVVVAHQYEASSLLNQKILQELQRTLAPRRPIVFSSSGHIDCELPVSHFQKLPFYSFCTLMFLILIV